MIDNHPTVRGVPCPDGKARTFFATGDADSFFSTPGYVNAYSRRVSGYLTTDDEGDAVFQPVLYRASAEVFPEAFLHPGVILELIHGDAEDPHIMSRGRVASWHFKVPPSWSGKAHWEVVIDWFWHNPEDYGTAIDLRDNGQQHDARSVVRQIVRGRYRIQPTHGLLPPPVGIGPRR